MITKEDILKVAKDCDIDTDNLSPVQHAYLDGAVEKIASSGLEKEAIAFLPLLLGGLGAYSGAQALGSAARGDWAGAGLNALGMLPGIGWLGKGLSRVGGRAAGAGGKMTNWAGGGSRGARWSGAGYGLSNPGKTLAGFYAAPWAVGKAMNKMLPAGAPPGAGAAPQYMAQQPNKYVGAMV